MNGLEARRRLDEWFAGTDWSPTLLTFPDFTATLNVQIGHVPPTWRALKRRRYAVPVAFVVNEANADSAVEDLYLALSWQDGSLIRALHDEPWVDDVTVDTLGPDEVIGAPFVRAEVTVHINDGDD